MITEQIYATLYLGALNIPVEADWVYVYLYVSELSEQFLLLTLLCIIDHTLSFPSRKKKHA